jgi:uncharacterized UPF0160 family protein
MSLVIATHSGPFHADDVMAVALIRTFYASDATVTRTRNKEPIDAADIVVDVGGIYDPSALRFDHHQSTYQGPLSAAGMVLGWLQEAGHIRTELATHLRCSMMDYLDDVDNGRVAPKPDVPCFARIVEAMNQPARTPEQFDGCFAAAAAVAATFLQGVVEGFCRVEQAHATIRAAMQAAKDAGRAVIFLDEYVPWKAPYFEADGAAHPTDFVLCPGTDGSWRVVAIPPELGSFAQKKPLPEPWAGLSDDELEAVTGIEGSVFCHKNRFIAVFKTREAAMTAMEQTGLMRRGS